MGSEDSNYKQAIGVRWENLCGKGYLFRWVEKNNIDSVIDEIPKM